MKLNENGYPVIRKITRKDRKTLSKLIKAFADRSGDAKITEMVPSLNPDGEKEAGKTEMYDLIKSVLEGLLEWVEEDVSKWFMDLIGVESREEYDALPFDIEINIIDQLIAEKGFNNFFLRVSDLYKKIRD